MTFAILTIAYKEERFIHLFTQHYKGLVDKILVMNSTKPYYINYNEIDYTKEIAEANGAEVVQGNWDTEEEQRNEGRKFLNTYDWVFVLDPDEFIKVEDFKNIKKYLNEVKKPHQHAYRVQKQITYWKDKYAIFPPEPYRQLIAINPREVRFIEKRNIGSEVWGLPVPFDLHHFSMARTDEEVFRKMTCFSHANEFDGIDWYKEKWLKWTEDTTDFHPTCPDSWHKAIKVKVPIEFQTVIDSLKEKK